MAENIDDYEPFDEAKKLHINEVLVPELDDAVLRVAKMRKKQPARCQSRAQKVVLNTAKHYDQFAVECERGDWDVSNSTVQHGLSHYGSIDSSRAQNLSALSKALTENLTERGKILKYKDLIGTSLDEDSQRISLPRLKRLPFFQPMPQFLEI